MEFQIPRAEDVKQGIGWHALDAPAEGVPEDVGAHGDVSGYEESGLVRPRSVRRHVEGEDGVLEMEARPYHEMSQTRGRREPAHHGLGEREVEIVLGADLDRFTDRFIEAAQKIGR